MGRFFKICLYSRMPETFVPEFSTATSYHRSPTYGFCCSIQIKIFNSRMLPESNIWKYGATDHSEAVQNDLHLHEGLISTAVTLKDNEVLARIHFNRFKVVMLKHFNTVV